MAASNYFLAMKDTKNIPITENAYNIPPTSPKRSEIE